MIATMDNNMKSISCYVLSTRLEKVLELFCEDGGRFDLVIERGCKRIGAQNWRRVRLEIAGIDLCSWEAAAACEWIKKASQLDVIFTNQSQIHRDVYCMA